MRLRPGLLLAALALAGCGGGTPTETATQQPDYLCPRDAPGQAVDSRTLEGLPLEEAERGVARYGCSIRVLSRDGQDFAGTLDIEYDRINVDVTDGIVSGVRGVH